MYALWPYGKSSFLQLFIHRCYLQLLLPAFAANLYLMPNHSFLLSTATNTYSRTHTPTPMSQLRQASSGSSTMTLNAPPVSGAGAGAAQQQQQQKPSKRRRRQPNTLNFTNEVRRLELMKGRKVEADVYAAINAIATVVLDNMTRDARELAWLKKDKGYINDTIVDAAALTRMPGSWVQELVEYSKSVTTIRDQAEVQDLDD
jgi:hypothetical protein